MLWHIAQPWNGKLRVDPWPVCMYMRPQRSAVDDRQTGKFGFGFEYTICMYVYISWALSTSMRLSALNIEIVPWWQWDPKMDSEHCGWLEANLRARWLMEGLAIWTFSCQHTLEVAVRNICQLSLNFGQQDQSPIIVRMKSFCIEVRHCDHQKHFIQKLRCGQWDNHNG